MTNIPSIVFRTVSFGIFFLGLALIMNRETLAASLQANATVTDEMVTLGDVATGLFEDPAMAEVVIAQAPAPGERFVIAAQTVLNIAYKQGVALDNPAGISRVAVERIGTLVPTEVINQRITQAMADLGYAGKYDVRFTGRRSALYVAMDSAPDVRVEGLQYDERANRFQARLIAGQQSDTVFGQIIPLVEVPVLAQRVSRGDVITENDILWTTIPESRLHQEVALDEADLVGLSPRRTLQADQPVRLRDLQEPVVVSKNASVTMLVSRPGLTLTAAGRALEDGAMGSVIKVINTDTHQTIFVEVIGPNQVRAVTNRNFVTAELAR